MNKNKNIFIALFGIFIVSTLILSFFSYQQKQTINQQNQNINTKNQKLSNTNNEILNLNKINKELQINNDNLQNQVISLQNEKSILLQDKDKVISKNNEFEECRKSNCEERKKKVLQFLQNDNSVGRVETDSFFKVGSSFPSLNELYKNQASPDLKMIIEENCPKVFYLESELSDWAKNMKKQYCEDDIENCPERVKNSIEQELKIAEQSFAEHYITIYDPDLTSSKYKQRAVVYFDDEANIICSWKYEKDDWFSMEEKITPIRIKN